MGDREVEFPKIWTGGGANTQCPQFFIKCRLNVTKTRHFKRKIHFFSGHGPVSLARPLSSGPTLGLNQAFCIRLCVRLEFQPDLHYGRQTGPHFLVQRRRTKIGGRGFSVEGPKVRNGLSRPAPNLFTELKFYVPLDKNRSFRRRSSQPISWLSTE